MLRLISTALLMLAALTLLTGLLYPLTVTGVAQIFYAQQANGSLIEQNGIMVGSELIGQPFDEPGYFWGRPSATALHPYNAAASGGSNLAPSNPALVDAVQLRIEALLFADPQNNAPIPVDLVTAAASGLDPHISVAAAWYQMPRVARERGMTEADLISLVNKFTERRQFGIFGEPRVNVLLLNLALNQNHPQGAIEIK